MSPFYRNCLAILVAFLLKNDPVRGGQLPSNSITQSPQITNTIQFKRWSWEFSQRASSRGLIPEGARLHAIEQIKKHQNELQTNTVHSQQTAESVQVQGDRWVSIGPAPLLNGQAPSAQHLSGRIADVAIDPANSNHWLIGAAQGGVWETSDAGTTWTPRTDDQASLAMGAIAFAPGAPNIIYAGTGEGVSSGDSYAGLGLLKSTDGGLTWQLLGTSYFAKASFSDIKVHPGNPNILLATTLRGLAGVSGGLLPSPPPVGIYKSIDGGTNWSLKLDANVRNMGGGWDLESHPTDFTKQYAGCGSIFGNPFHSSTNGIYRSTDTGETWQLVTGPWSTLTDRVERVELAIAPSNPNILYVSIQDAFGNNDGTAGALLGIWKTVNAWDANPAWTQIPNPSGTSTRFWYNHEIIVDPANANILYLGEVSLWKYNSSSWADVTGDIHSDEQTMAWAGNRLVVGNDGGVWSTTNGGNSWSNHNTNLAVTQFYQGSLHPVNPNFALGGSQDNGIQTWQGPLSWMALISGDGSYSTFSSSNPDTDWAFSNENLEIFRTKNGGVTYSSAISGIDTFNALFIAPFKKCPCNDDIFIAATDNLWKTTNFFSGIDPSWFSNGPELGDFHTALAFAPSDTNCNTYALGTLSAGQIRLTTNGGSTWTVLATFGRYVSALAFHPTNANILYITLSSFDDPAFPPAGHVFKTTNALAATPQFLNVSTPVDIPHNTIVLDPSNPNVVYVGTDIGVWRSMNAGVSWTHMGPESGLPNVAVFDLEISPGSGRLVAFTHGRGAFALQSPPRLLPGAHNGSSFSLSFATLPGTQYAVEYKNLLSEASWRPLGSVNGDGTVKVLVDTNATSPQRFYRATIPH